MPKTPRPIWEIIQKNHGIGFLLWPDEHNLAIVIEQLADLVANNAMASP